MTKIGLISDIHFGKFSRTQEFSVPGEPIQEETTGAESLEKGLVDILKEQKVGYLFVAGDLTSVGSPQEFYYCEEKLLKIARDVGISKENIICGLGNHDVDRMIAEVWKSNDPSKIKKGNKRPKDLEDLIKKYYQMIAASVAGTCMERLKITGEMGIAPYSGVIEKEEFIVFVLNSSWKCNGDQEYSHGVLTMEQLKWLKKVAAPYQDDSRKKIILMHHHPIDYSFPTHCEDVSKVEEGSELMDWAGKYGINIILHGHRHHPKAKTCMETGWKNPITIICAGSLSVCVKYRGEVPNTFHILEFDKEDETVYLYNYKYSGGRGWEPIKKSTEETPMNAKMLLGKVFEDNQIREAIVAYNIDGIEVKWENLPECLKYMKHEELDIKFRECIEEDIHIYGNFPGEVYLRKM